MKKKCVFLLFCFSFLVTLEGSVYPEFQDKALSIIKECDQHSIQEVSEEFFSKGFVERIGEDQAIRPSFVTMQAIIEQICAFSLYNGEIKQFKGAIHTPLPATPLCMETEFDPLLAKKEICEDSSRVQTIVKRAQTLRAIADQHGELVIIYLKDGLEKRSPKQQKIFKKTCEIFNPFIKDRVLLETLPEHLIGATYLFTDDKDVTYLFSIQATQAIDARDQMCWRLWLDKIDAPKVKERLKEVGRFLNPEF